MLIAGLLAEARRCVNAHQPTAALDLVIQAERLRNGEAGVFRIMDEARANYAREQEQLQANAMRAAQAPKPQRAAQQMGPSAAGLFDTAFGNRSLPPSVLSAFLQQASSLNNQGAAAS